ncbi:hypothetical protein FOB58_002885 [Candida parapsilosis]|uniref:Uncharacterized protein n=2 Tax=Candida parapsilosis TaxID=5480 RepID=G8B7L1_CANPC|nr:uncharacterized protein CPAR2_104820 [Candida parapsilosis]KAF6048436.1 hypothetical protein FOB59_003478 [Candida parapsilosis]KAF6049608.1 hypothetical protein FOB58_002885 [Candida parapsilosis]KAF6057459.1 hypothetical protein FOB60_002014 [Candida parapsilosis]KAF6065822.1 hypothetical protein FOB61_001892 [Candida parapsilosis]KAI5902823.1 hypothetical protein K4G60_g1967 [Candida parapsilosis]
MNFEYDNTHFSNDIEIDDTKNESHSNDVENLSFNGDSTHCFTVDPHSNINFNSIEWEYLQIAQQSLHHPHPHQHNNTPHNSGLEVSPSISNHTLQSLRPTFSTGYDTDNTDLLGMLDSQNPSNLNLPTNQDYLSSDSLLNSSANTYKDSHGFNFEHHLDSSYWEYLLEKENMLHDNEDIPNVNTTGYNNMKYDEDGLGKVDDDVNDKDIQSVSCSPSTIDDEDLAGSSNNYNQNDNIMQYHSNEETAEFGKEEDDEECVWDERLSYENHTRAEDANFFSDPLALQLSVVAASSSRPSPTVKLTNITRNKGDRYITTPIYEWPDDETTGSTRFYNKMKVRLSSLEPKCVSDAVLKTVREEFVIQDSFLNGESPPSPEVPESIRKRSDRDVEWTPLSVYKAYTNIKSPTNGKESYNRLVPYTSCIGTLNYRPKDHAAWKRAPNRRQ